MTHLHTTTEFAETAHWAGASETTIENAVRCTAPRLVVSGRLASGKDTVAEAAMAALGRVDAVRVSFATALRRETDAVFDAVRTRGLGEARSIVGEAVGEDTPASREAAELVVRILQDNPQAHSYLRTTEIRHLLQVWGTGIRRAQDESYWTKQGVQTMVEHLAEQRAVYVTDARFVNEVELAKQLGFLAVRLEVSSEIRAARLWERDGLRLDPMAENHPSELELEHYRGFDLWVENSGSLSESTAAVCDALRARFA